MKKLLLTLLSLTVVVSTAATVIACDKNKTNNDQNNNNGGVEKPKPPEPEKPKPPIELEISFEDYIKKFPNPIDYLQKPITELFKGAWNEDFVLSDSLTQEHIIQTQKWKSFFYNQPINDTWINITNIQQEQNGKYAGYYDAELTNIGVGRVVQDNFQGIYTKHFGKTWDQWNPTMQHDALQESLKLKITGSIRVYFVLQDLTTD
ncbi:hypothetical protein [Williamsoniiplasma luminosum]|uniref:Lipoprotein n=1 Tax=Williamsoniiplasma luminosum TaxID=214888 RepID=A0A2S0NL00_9MOLU|nr:hypothetical protein [Williamsoniiplasma luminosum]AVP49703.1 MAG: hypothetical protein C5T88_03960 [Williamsoniiplasma luminosum]